MFDSVCGQVHLQAGSVRVTTVTVVTLVRLVFVVLPTVRLQGGKKRHADIQTISCFVAARCNVYRSPATGQGDGMSQHGDKHCKILFK